MGPWKRAGQVGVGGLEEDRKEWNKRKQKSHILPLEGCKEDWGGTERYRQRVLEASGY